MNWVYDSENWSAYQPFPVSGLFILVFGAKLSRSCHIRDKGVFARRVKYWFTRATQEKDKDAHTRAIGISTIHRRSAKRQGSLVTIRARLGMSFVFLLTENLMTDRHRPRPRPSSSPAHYVLLQNERSQDNASNLFYRQFLAKLLNCYIYICFM